MPISKGLIPNSPLCLIPKVLLQCHVSGHFMSNSKGLPTPIPRGCWLQNVESWDWKALPMPMGSDLQNGERTCQISIGWCCKSNIKSNKTPITPRLLTLHYYYTILFILVHTEEEGRILEEEDTWKSNEAKTTTRRLGGGGVASLDFHVSSSSPPPQCVPVYKKYSSLGVMGGPYWI